MVVSRDKRKRKGSPATKVPPPTPEKPLETPKRTKIQAQRKFAQGQGTSATSVYLNHTTFSNPTPPKEQREPTELLPNERPNTEDFLTFLCFRNTPALPPNLDFFNPANRRSGGAAATAVGPSTSAAAKKKAAAAEKKAKAAEIVQPSTSTTLVQAPVKGKSKAAEKKIVEPPVVVEEKEEKEDADKPKYMPFAVRKRAEQFPDLKVDKKKKMLALKKKYLDQRVAKLKTIPKVVQATAGRRTRSNRAENNPDDKMDEEEELSEADEDPTPEKVVPAVPPAKKRGRPSGKKTPTPQKVKTDETEVASSKGSATVQTKSSTKRKSGLRSAIFTNYNDDIEDSMLDDEEPTTNLPKKSLKLDKPAASVAKKPKDGKKPADASTPKKRNTRLGGVVNNKSDDSLDDVTTTPDVTPLKVEVAVEKAPKAASSPKPKVTTKASPEKNKPTTEMKAKAAPKKSENDAPAENVDEFSSDDDAPLVSRKTGTESPASKTKVTKKKADKKKEKPTKPTESPKTVKKVEPDEPAPPPPVKAEEKEPKAKKGKAVKSVDTEPVPVVETPVPEEKPVVKGKRGRKKKVVEPVISLPPPPVGSPELAANTSQTNTADLSENAISARPSRKTKDAANIYMELIGRRLNLRELSDDDASSLDSLELPNVKRMEQMENECKANAVKKDNDAKKKKEVEPTPPPSLVVAKKEETASPVSVKKGRKSPKKEEKEATEPLEKSFSESDEEPLAIKIQKKEPPAPKKTKGRKSNSTPVKRGKKSPTLKEKSPLPLTPPPVSQTVTDVEEVKVEIPHRMTPTTPHTGEEHNNSFKAVKFTPESNNRQLGKQSLLSPVNKALDSPVTPTTSQQKEPLVTTPFSRSTKIELPPEDEVLKTFIDEKSKPINLLGKQSTSLNILPSAEESQKIFGIASLTLAQSSGPLDTKCTLGKCGSVHKPSLGPAVLTEVNLGGHLSARDRRKAKVNMTHEQIQKWLDETSWSPVPDDMPMDDDAYDKPLKPSRCDSPPLTVKDEDASSMRSFKMRLKEERERKEAQEREKGRERSLPSPSPQTKGPTLKATAVVKEKESILTPLGAPARVYEMLPKKDGKNQNKSSPTPKVTKSTPPPEVSAKHATEKGDTLSQDSSKTADKKSKTSKTLEKKEPIVLEPKTSSSPSAVKLTPIPMPEVKSSPKTVKQTASEAKPTKQEAAPPPASSKESLQMDRKPIYNQRRQAVSKPTNSTPPPPKGKAAGKSKVPAPSPSMPVAKYLIPVNTFGAFSPENEHSVYSFDKEDDALPVTTPFRQRKGGKEHTEDSNSSFQKPQSSANTTPAKKPGQEVSLTLSPEDHSKSASIPTTSRKLLDLGEVKMSPMDDNDSDGSEGHTFYIPLQGANAASGSKSEQLIQGVKVKLGTEGPEGPNQRVIMHAKLVTKTQMGTNTTPIPESMANVQEIVKTLMAGKELKSVPVGTVQPRFKSEELTLQPPASTSSAAVPVTNLSRINSNSSLSSLSKQPPPPPPVKYKNEAVIHPNNITAFPRRDDPAQMVEAPIFRPTDKEFQDPIEYFERIAPVAARFGICRIIPPDSFKPECKVSDEMRFTAYNQYVHKMLHRWGPSAKELAAIKKYLVTQSIDLHSPPLIGGMEVDLPRLYHTVQELGGLKEVIEKKKWARVAEEMCIPKTAHDRNTKLDDIYCKYLLPYDTLSPGERQKLFDAVEADWAKREAKARRHADKCVESSSNNDTDDDEANDDDSESEENVDGAEGDGDMECIVKGRSMALSQFFRIARNTMSIWFKSTEPTTAEIEAEFWRHVAVRDSHVCVHSGSIDSSGWGYGFPTPGPKTKGSTCAKHPWNLKVLTNNHGSILRSLGPVMGVTVPTLHVGMLFSACCWYRDPHGLPWIEYLHTGGSKIWYGIPDDQNHNFRAAVTNLVPTHCQNKTIWLPCDTMMIPPHMLTDRKVSLSRTEQKPGEFVIVFPRAYTSSVCSGYTVSESVYFASNMWLDTAKQDFEDIKNSCEPTMFSIEQLLFAIASDQRSNNDTLAQILPMLNEAYEKEKQARQALKDANVTRNERLTDDSSKSGKIIKATEEYECDLCRSNLYISMIKYTASDDDGTADEEQIYCLKHAIKYLNDNRLQPKRCRLAYNYSIEEIKTLIKQINDKLAGREQQAGKRKSGAKAAGQASGSK